MTWQQEMVADWTDVTGGVMSAGRIVRALRPLLAHVATKNDLKRSDGTLHLDAAWAKLRPWWQEYLSLEDPRFRSPERFAASPGIVLVLRRKKQGDGLSRLLRGER